MNPGPKEHVDTEGNDTRIMLMLGLKSLTTFC